MEQLVYGYVTIHRLLFTARLASCLTHAPQLALQIFHHLLGGGGGEPPPVYLGSY